MMNYNTSLSTINGKHLMEEELKPIRYIIDDMISAGVHILAGSPKIGKSWMSLWLCLSVANGTDVWDFKTHKGGVLYMALEDSPNRLQARLRKLNMPVPDNIHFTLTASDLDSGLLDQLENFMQEHPDTSLIVIDGYVTFITGMAMGTDIWAAEIILERKKSNKDLHLICALPHTNFESRRSMTEKMRFNKIIKNADLVKEINNHYFTGCYQVRNKWMVDRSNLVIAVFNGQKSGTKNTVDYAKRKGINVVNVLDGIKSRF